MIHIGFNFLFKGVFYLFQSLARLFKNRNFQVIATYILMQFSTLIVSIALLTFTEMDEFSALIFPNIGAFIIGFIIIWSLLRNRLREEREQHPIGLGKIIAWSIIGFFLAWIGQILAITIEMQVLGIQPGSENTDFVVQLAQENIWFLLLPAIIGPIIEELVFRKVIFGSLRNRMGVHASAVVAALIFAVVHMDLEHTLIYFVMGLVFTFLYVKTKRIIVPIIAHMSMNTMAVVAQMLIDPEELEKMREQLTFILLGGWF